MAFYHDHPDVLVVQTGVLDSRPGLIADVTAVTDPRLYESTARAMTWRHSDQYRAARGMRQAATRTSMIVVERAERAERAE